MHLRKLELKDAPLMLEWMHDKSVTQNLRTNFAQKTIFDVENFIKKSYKDTENINLAIVSDEDEYMGTVSLKNIENSNAEFAITVRTKAMGRGYSWFGMKNAIRIAFDELSLQRVYWCVSKKNVRAVRFYDKHNFQEVIDVPDSVLKRYDGIGNLKWYSVLKGDGFYIKDGI